MLDLSQLLQIPRVDAGFDISPEGTHVAFSWNKTGQWQIYELELDRTQHFSQGTPGSLAENSLATSLTSDPGGKLNLRYALDGMRLAYALDFDGAETIRAAPPVIHWTHVINLLNSGKKWNCSCMRMKVMSF